ncbi:MAG: DUF459 domain-containing protein [Acidimicrobiales bacterium]|nr:DUF459 domain-containing protein [Acidimicrobiales bacterium]
MIRPLRVLSAGLLLVATACGSDAATQPTTTSATHASAPVPTSAEPPVAVRDDGRPITAADPLKVVVIGDSVTYELVPALAAALESTGVAETTEVTQWGFALSSDTRIRWRETWPGLLGNAQPDLVVMQTGSWDVDVNLLAAERDPNPEDEDWERAFAAVLDEAAFRLTFNGAKVLWLSMLPGPDPSASERLNEATKALADRNPNVAWIDAAAPIRAPDGSFVEVDLSGRFLRKPDGVHVCVDGAQLVIEVVAEYLADRFGLSFGSWQDGAWRDSGRYRLDPCLDVAATDLVVAGEQEEAPG